MMLRDTGSSMIGAIGDGEDALQLVGHDHEGEAEILAQRQDGSVQVRAQ